MPDTNTSKYESGVQRCRMNPQTLSSSDGYNPKPEDKPLTTGYQPTARPRGPIVAPPPPKNRKDAKIQHLTRVNEALRRLLMWYEYEMDRSNQEVNDLPEDLRKWLVYAYA
jgi:hypothetical protein